MSPARPVFGTDERPFQVNARAHGSDQRDPLDGLREHRELTAESFKIRRDHSWQETGGAGP
jgi:hypothetical protein